MALLDTWQLKRLLRDLELTAPVAIRRGLAQAEQYLWLLVRLRSTDLRVDAVYQQRLSRFIGLRGKLRAQRTALFETLHDLSTLDEVEFAEVLRRISALTGQVEKSAASMFMALLQPDLPWIDRDIRELLPRYGCETLAEAPTFAECVAWYDMLRTLFDEVLAAPRWLAIGRLLDLGLGRVEGAVLTEARKLNLHLSHSRRAVALMPTLELRPAGLVGMPVGAVAPTSSGERTPPRGAVLLHLCR